VILPKKTPRKNYDIKTVCRDHTDSPLFNISPQEFVQKFETMPFLNGGPFECLDKREGSEQQKYIDGFSHTFQVEALFSISNLYATMPSVQLECGFAANLRSKSGQIHHQPEAVTQRPAGNLYSRLQSA
jgi:hypothetical protein